MIDFEDFTKTLKGELPTNAMRLESYIGSTAHQILRDTKLPSKMTYRQLLAFIWKEQRNKISPANIPCFALAGVRDDETSDEYIELIDDNDLPFLVFDPCGIDCKYADVISRGILERKEVLTLWHQAEAHGDV